MRGDPFLVPEHLIPPGMSYQWFQIQPEDGNPKPDITWEPVPYGRMSDYFGGFADNDGTVVVLGCRLMQRPKELSDSYIKECEAKARKQEEEQLRRMQEICAEAGYVGFDIMINKTVG